MGRASKPMRPAITPEGREAQLISLAADLAEKQLREDRASAQVLTHFLKLGSTRERLEQQKILQENLLLSAKIDQMDSAKRMEELYEQAIHAMKAYSGNATDDDYYDMG